jgi:hypothetical protein
METDDLATLWQSGNVSLANAPVTFGALAARDRARSTLFSITLGRWFTLASNAVAVLALGSYTGDHLREPHVGPAALVLFVTAVALLISSIIQAIVGSVDLSAAPLDVQRRAAAAERIRVATDTAVLCASSLLWTPLAIVSAKVLLGIDPVLAFGMPWIIGNLAFGLVALGLGAAFVKPIRRLVAGSTLARVNARLADLARFAISE